MQFNSPEYFLFLPVVYLIFLAAPERGRWFVLLLASLGFYALFKVPYLLVVLLLVTVTAYLLGLGLQRCTSPKGKGWLLAGGILGNLLILCLLKYLPSAVQQLAGPLAPAPGGAVLVEPQAVAAIGVSYYVFQAIAYLVDVFLEKQPAERHFGYFALYMAFFPKLLQGPIERAGELLPQLKTAYRFDYENVRLGLLLFAWGLYKKLVLADRLGEVVDRFYQDPSSASGLTVLLVIYAYSFQIYLDFSAYTDMALGSARLFNISLTQNFDSPYLATSVAEFWRRWHISFSRWILDYLFTPLQMRWRAWKSWGTATALLLAFLVSGLWHGADWGFVIWGALHGLFLGSSVFYRPIQKRLHRALHLEKSGLLRVWQVLVTFNLVSFAWVFFRADSVQQATLVLQNLFLEAAAAPAAPATGLVGQLRSIPGALGLKMVDCGILVLSSGMFLLFSGFYSRGTFAPLRNFGDLSRWSLYAALVTMIMCFASTGSNLFLYCNF
jgi:D-alanyl-lipoteichoic acid acyltransferase DltB (MBOAT superfamily)